MAKMEDMVNDFIATQLEEIDDQIALIDNSKVVKAAQELLAKKQILMATRRALLGGNTLTGGASGTRIAQSDVVGAFTNGEGLTVPAIAAAIHTTEAVVRGHLNRGKDERFIKKGHLWFLRDPEAGVNTADDVDGEED